MQFLNFLLLLSRKYLQNICRVGWSSGADREADCAADREAVFADADGEREVGGMTATNDYAGAATLTFLRHL